MSNLIAIAQRKQADCWVRMLRMFWLFLLTTGAAYCPQSAAYGASGAKRGTADRVDRASREAEERPQSVERPRKRSDQQQEQREVVFLLHGICKSSYDMVFLAQSLRRAGYEVVNLSYPSRRYDLDGLADRLAEELEPHSGRRVNFVTHSMGGIVVRTYLSKYQPPNVGRLVMIAPPNKGAILADLLGDWMVYKLLFGPAGQQLRQGEAGGCEAAGIPTCEFAIIAGGNGKAHGMNPIIPGDNDGTVSVECTKLDGMKDFMVVPYGHTYIQFMPRTVENTLHFLHSGHFAEHCPSREGVASAPQQEPAAVPAQ